MSDRESFLTQPEVADAGKRGRGNPEKWSDVGRQTRFLDALREGYSIGGACIQAGWDYVSWRKWAAAAEAAERDGERCKYSDLLDAYREAVRDGDEALFRTVRSAATHGDTNSAKWILERRTSRTWAKPTEVEVSGPGGGPVQVDVRSQLLAAARALSDADVGLTDPHAAAVEAALADGRTQD